MAVYFLCKSCQSLQKHNIGFDSKQSLESSLPNSGGDATCRDCGESHEYRRADLIWKQDESPYHTEWEASDHDVSLADFFVIVDAFDPAVRDECMIPAFMTVIDPQTAVEYISVHDRIGDTHDPVNYRIFKEKCKLLAELVQESMIVDQAIRDVLEYLYPRTDCTRLPEIVANNRRLIERCELQIENASQDWQREQMQDLIDKSLDWIANSEKQVDRDIYLYETFCYDVVRPLLS